MFEKLFPAHHKRRQLAREENQAAPPGEAPREWLGPGWFDKDLIPALDVSETDKEIVVRAELPDIDTKEVDITVEGGYLTIRGEKKTQREQKNENVLFREIRGGSFSRTIGLPGEVDAGKAQAKYKKGILTVSLPKIESTRRRLKIET
jgi:HSP20 family protein